MSIFLHQIQPWMTRSAAEAEEHLERKMDHHTAKKVMEVHQHLEAFELRVLARPSPGVDLTALQACVECLRVELDTILKAWVP